MLGYKKDNTLLNVSPLTWGKVMIKESIQTALLLTAVISFSSFAQDPLPPPPEVATYKNRVVFERTPDKFTILRDGQEIFTFEGNISRDLILHQGYNLSKIGSLKEINDPLIIVQTFSGGAHCCYMADILDLDKINLVLAHFDGNNSDVVITQLKGKNGFRIQIQDASYSYEWTSYAYSHAPAVVFNFEDGKVSLNLNEMRKPPLTLEQLNNVITEINKAEKYFEGSADMTPYYGNLLQPILDLIYSGNADQVRPIIDGTWPRDEASKHKFLKELQEKVEKNKFWPGLKQLNKCERLFL